jgi:hypothetical protein
MAEKSIRLADATSGIRMATRDAFETDDSSNPRVIERVDLASGKVASPIGEAKRGNSAAISAADTLDLTSLLSDLTTNLIVVGDKGLLVVAAEQSVSVEVWW